MIFRHADFVSLSLFSLFCVLMLVVCTKALSFSAQGKRWMRVHWLLILVFSVASLSGLVIQNFVPFGPILFATLFGVSILFSVSDAGTKLAEGLGLEVLIGFQGFRLFLELILHHWAQIGTVPETMTWTGHNWDVFAGVLSMVMIPLVKKSWKLGLVVNTVGFLLLLNVVRVVVLSSPLPFSWELEKPLLLVAYFPYCLIGPLFVMPAMTGHLIAYKKIFKIGTDTLLGHPVSTFNANREKNCSGDEKA